MGNLGVEGAYAQCENGECYDTMLRNGKLAEGHCLNSEAVMSKACPDNNSTFIAHRCPNGRCIALYNKHTGTQFNRKNVG